MARALGKRFRLVHIDTKISLPETREYIEKYAKWLGAELLVVSTKYDYFELVRQFGYPSVLNNRWCWRLLKQEPLYRFRIDEMKEGVEGLWVLGIRSNESRLRLENYGRLRNTLHKTRIKDLPVVEWLPILYLSGPQVSRLIREFNIPQNPVWYKLGISGDCLCLAGATRKTLEALFTQYPDVAERFYNFDKQLVARHEGSLVPLGLWSEKKRLYQFIEEVRKQKKQATLTEYLSCQGACFVL